MSWAGGYQSFEDLMFWNAIRSGNLPEISRLVDAGESLNRIDRRGMTPLLYAVQLKQNDFLAYVLRHEVDLEHNGPDGDTALIHAVRSGIIVMVDMLLTAGAFIDGRDRYGATALMKSVERGDMAMIKRLLRAGADRTLTDYGGRDAMHYAINQRDGRVRRLLQE